MAGSESGIRKVIRRMGWESEPDVCALLEEMSSGAQGQWRLRRGGV